MREIVVNKHIAGQRLDKFLMRYLGAAPKTFVHKMIRKKNIVVNGKRVEGSYIIAADDIINLYLSDETIDKFTKTTARGEFSGGLDIIYEDENIAIVNKSANLLTQPDSAHSDSLVSRLRHQTDSDFAPVAVNRLDRNTTGIVLCAKTLASAQILSKLVHDRAIGKHYLAAVHGEISREMVLEGYHTKDEAKNLVKIVPRGTAGQHVITKIAPMGYDPAQGITLLKIVLETGRSHQIRAHLASIGHPIVGDFKYGGKGGTRQMLHAHEVVFGPVDGVLSYLSSQSFTSPLPKDMEKLIVAVNLKNSKDCFIM